MFGLLLDDKIAAQAAEKIRSLKESLLIGGVRFADIFPVLLTDNGGEFANVAAFTNDSKGTSETRLYFCDPYRSSQKPRVEKNHSIFRDIVPKGESFDHFTQDTVNLIFSHVNGSKRKILNGKSPYELFVFVYGEELASLLGITYISAEDIIQSDVLLKAINKTPPTPIGNTLPDAQA
jgi:IS30 family transposase